MGRASQAGPVACLLLLTAAAGVTAQPVRLVSNEPLPIGHRVEVKDGDTIVVRGDARVRVIHRSEAMVRAIFNADQRSLILLADYVDPRTSTADGFVDSTYSFEELDGAWPLGERWEGSAVIDDYGVVLGPTAGLALSVNGAYVQLLQGSPMSNTTAAWYADSRAIQLTYRGSGRTSSPVASGHVTFAQAEEHALAEAARNAQNRARRTSTVSPGTAGGATPTASLSFAGTVPGGARSGDAPVRVGSSIATPRRIVDARPVLPPAALQANVRGVVILEIVVATDGSVTDARVLRSIPMLDQAALDAVKQWRYEPTQINGRTVPVIMTVTVAFE